MSFLVKDFSPARQRWVSWIASSIPSAYDDYPYTDSMFPSVAQLSKKLTIIKEMNASGLGGLAPEASVWARVGDDLIPSYIVDGHTGQWAIEIRRQEIKNEIGISTDGVNTEVAYNSYLSYKLDENGNITSEVTFDNEVQGFMTDSGQVVFKTPSEYSLDDLNISLPSNSSMPNSFVDIVPSSSSMPDLFWKRISEEIILK